MLFETNVPIPAPVRGGVKYPFTSLAVGESVLYPCAIPERRNVRQAAYAAQRVKGWSITVRSTRAGVRVWRKS